MSIVLFDGFEAAPVLRHGMSGTAPTVVTGRDGTGKGVHFGTNGTAICPLPTAVARPLIGFGCKTAAATFGSTSSGQMNLIIYGDAGGTGHLCVNFSADGHFLLRRGATANGTILATSTAVITPNVWHYWEVKCTIADAGGTFILKVDGVEVLNFVGDTKNGGTLTTVSTIGWGGAQASQYDDLYVLDLDVDGTTLTPPQKAAYQDWIGERVVKVARIDGDGASTQWTPNTAVPNYTVVDEDPWSASADYVVAPTAGLTDLYTFADVIGLSSIDAVQSAWYALKSDAGARTMRTVTRSAAGTLAESGDNALSTSVAVVEGPIRGKDPDGNVWTLTNLNASQFGIKSGA